MYLIWSSQRVSPHDHWNRDCPADFFGATGSHGIVGKKTPQRIRIKGRWKHIFSADDGRGSSCRKSHCINSCIVRSCGWCMTHCCVLWCCDVRFMAAEKAGFRTLDPWHWCVENGGNQRISGTKMDKTATSMHPSYFLPFCISWQPSNRPNSLIFFCVCTLTSSLSAEDQYCCVEQCFSKGCRHSSSFLNSPTSWWQQVGRKVTGGHQLDTTSSVIRLFLKSVLHPTQSWAKISFVNIIRETSSGSKTLAIKIELYISLWNSSIQEDTKLRLYRCESD